MRNKKLSFFTILIAIFVVVCGFSGAKTKVYDEANLYTASQRQQLEEKIIDLVDEIQCDIGIVTALDVGSDTDEYIDNFFFEYDFGYGSSKQGVLFFIDMDNRQFRIFDYDDERDYFFTDSQREELADRVRSMLSNGEYMNAANYFLQFVEIYGMEDSEHIREEQLENLGLDDLDENSISISSSIVSKIVGSACIAMGVSVVIVVIMAYSSNNKKSVHSGTYLKQGSMKLNRKIDRYTHTTVVKRKIEKPSTSNSGGRSSTHSTSSGGRSSGGGF